MTYKEEERRRKKKKRGLILQESGLKRRYKKDLEGATPCPGLFSDQVFG